MSGDNQRGEHESVTLVAAGLATGTYVCLDEEGVVIAAGVVDDPPMAQGSSDGIPVPRADFGGDEDDAPTNPGVQRYERTIVGALMEDKVPAPTRKDE